MTQCIFCSIIAGTSPASFVHRDEMCSAFLDIQPVTPGHVLVVPNEHATYLADLPAGTGGHLFEVGRQVAAALRASPIRCEGVNLYLCDGAVSGQEVMHVHLHVIPRFRGDGFGLRLPPSYGQMAARRLLDEQADLIRSALDTQT